MAPLVGFEPTTIRLEVWCSVLLRYRGIDFSGARTLKSLMLSNILTWFPGYTSNLVVVGSNST